MKWSFKVARIAGTEVRIHVTFLLLLAYFAWAFSKVGGTEEAICGVLFICALFFCVLLHEFGHITAARRYGIKTPDVTLLPIGGVARLERMPKNPLQEFVVAIAGPLVNVAIAAILYLVLWEFPALGLRFELKSFGNFLPALMKINIMLVLFNMLPAFPMDGGRVLRAILATGMTYAKATRVAAKVGQTIALVGGLYAFLSPHVSPLLILIAIFVYFGAEGEAEQVEIEEAIGDLEVSKGMVTSFQSLPATATLGDAAEALLTGAQQDFPVIGESGGVAGILGRAELVRGLAEGGRDRLAADSMRTDLPSIKPDSLLEDGLHALRDAKAQALAVVDSEGKLVGILTRENVGELIMVRQALATPQGQALRPLAAPAS